MIKLFLWALTSKLLEFIFTLLSKKNFKWLTKLCNNVIHKIGYKRELSLNKEETNMQIMKLKVIASCIKHDPKTARYQDKENRKCYVTFITRKEGTY